MPFEKGYRVEECTVNRDASGDEGKGNPAGAECGQDRQSEEAPKK